ncbi:MAG: response regulator transcription factor [Lachnospiraceae bacterium]|nr:response regulator transcription factor [Lachnospiraceae bacterium]
MYNILVCDDERDIVEALKIYLEAEGYRTFPAYTGKEALAVMERAEIHLALMDIMMPVMDGITAMVEIRRRSNVPVILLTAKGEDTDKILGLNVGADDYVTKPFNPVEVLARVRSQLRRYMQLGSGKKEERGLLVLGGIELDPKAVEVRLDGERLSLTPTEYEILKLFMEHPGEVLSPKEIYRRVWKEAPVSAEGTVAVHIRHLREKIEITPSDPRYLKVVWGQGYKLERGDRP